MKIAHEAPLSLMKYVKQVTDYDYALASLFGKVDGYYEYFIQAKKEGRKIILDNGVFEEGKAMEENQYVAYISGLQPDEYIVPDILEDANRTISSFEDWLLRWNELPGKKIGVVQGKTIEEFIECYKFMSEYADKIAISFNYIFYQNIYPQQEGVTKETKWAQGRLWIVGQLHSLGIWNMKKPHHLLGSAVPCEFQGYFSRQPSFISQSIETIDTSNPVVYAIATGRFHW